MSCVVMAVGAFLASCLALEMWSQSARSFMAWRRSWRSGKMWALGSCRCSATSSPSMRTSNLAVTAGDKGKGANVVADAIKGVAGHPGGAEGVASIVAVFDFDGVFFRVGHGGGSFGGGFVCRNRRGFWVFASFRFSFGDDSFAKSNMAVIGGGSGVDPAVLGIRICFFFSWRNEWWG